MTDFIQFEEPGVLYKTTDLIYKSKIILEVKARQNVIQEYYRQTINYLAASKLRLGLIINFGEDSLKFKRVIL